MGIKPILILRKIILLITKNPLSGPFPAKTLAAWRPTSHHDFGARLYGKVPGMCNDRTAVETAIFSRLLPYNQFTDDDESDISAGEPKLERQPALKPA